MRLRRPLAVLLTAAVVFAAGCSSKQSSPPPAQTPAQTAAPTPAQPAAPDLEKEGLPAYNPKIAEKGDVTVEFWFAADYYNQAPIVDAAKQFESVYPNVKINLSGTEWGQMGNKVKTAVTGGAPPDLAHQWAYAFGAQGFAEPLDDLWAQWGEESKFLPGAMTGVTWKGSKYGVQLDVNTLYLIYNKEMWANVGVTQPPKTLPELKDVLQKVAKPSEGIYGTIASASGWGMYGLVRSNGGDLLKTENGKVIATLDDPKVVEAVKWLTDAAKEGLSPVPPQQARQTDHPVAYFGQSRGTAFFSGPWDIKRIETEAPPEMIKKVATAKLPGGFTGSTTGSVMGGGGMFVPKGAKNKEIAFEFMKWLVSDKYAKRIAEEMGRFPVKTHQYQWDLFKDPLLAPFIEQLDSAKPFPLDPYPEASTAWGKAIRAAFDGGDAAELLKEANKVAQEAIDQAEGQ